MKRLLLVWGVLLAAAVPLGWWEHALDARAAAERETAFRIGRVIRADERAALAPAAVSVGRRDGPRFLFGVDAKGVWRCYDHFAAVASEERVNALLKAILEAEGVVRTRDEERAADYGLGTPDSWQVRLHGPQVHPPDFMDVRFQVELGDPLPEGGGGFLRRYDDSGIWEIDTDPWTPLANPPGIPPLIDPYLVPRVWPGASRRVDRTEVFLAGGAAFSITLHDLQITEDELRQGKSPYEWHLHAGDLEVRADPRSSMAYTSFLFVTPFDHLLDPARAREFRFGEPRGVIRMHPAQGEVCELRVAAAALDDGRVPVVNLVTGSLYAIDARVADLLLPAADAFRDDAAAPAWEEYLRRR